MDALGPAGRVVTGSVCRMHEGAGPRPAGPAGADRAGFPVGARVTLAELDGDPHPVLRMLRATEPVSWLPALGGWLVTSRDIALRVLRDARGFTVDDPRFSTARVVGPSMLSLDGAEHARHRGPFAAAFGRADVEARLAAFVRAEADRQVRAIRADGQAELRRRLAGPLAVAVVAEVLGLGGTAPAVMLSWYDAIVAAVSALTADAALTAGPARPAGPAARPGRRRLADVLRQADQAFGALDASVRAAVSVPPAAAGQPSPLAVAASLSGLEPAEVVSDAAVAMFGGIETTEGMIANLLLHVLSNPGQLRLLGRLDPGARAALAASAVEESLRLEPAAAVVDRYATAGVSIGAAAIRRGDLVTVSLAGANRDPAAFTDPDSFDVRRANARQHLAFAHGPHFCLGAHLARAEAQEALLAVLRILPGVRVVPGDRSAPRGLVFRKPPSLRVSWDT